MDELPDAAEPSPRSGSEAAPLLSIAAISRLLGVPAPTLRSWERRYGVPQATRSGGGHRRYGPAEVELLRRMAAEIAAGRPASRAAVLARGAATGPRPHLDALLSAATALDGRAVGTALDAARDVLGLDRTVDEVLLPAMRGLGEGWADGQVDVSLEHGATAGVLGWLERTTQEAEPPTGATVVLACGPDDQHTIGLAALATLLAHRGVDGRTLGARVPAESLVNAVVTTRAVAAVVVAQLPRTRSAALTSLRALEQTGAGVFYAGAAFDTPAARVNAPGRYLGLHLARAADLLAAELRHPGNEGGPRTAR